MVFIAPALPLPPAAPRSRAAQDFDERRDEYVGWGKWNRHYWLEDYEDFLEFFFAKSLTEPHSTKQREDTVGWGRETDAETLVATQLARRLEDEEGVRELLARVDCPVLVIHGRDDAIRPWESGARLAELANGALTVLDGSGHLPHARDPVKVNLLLRDFIKPPAPPRRWVRGKSRRRRALYISSPIGLGHAQRDVAIADELRQLRPDLEIDWLAQHPVTTVLRARGEHIHPASAYLANESGHIESESAEHDLHCFQAIRRMDEILLANFMVFHDLVRDEQYDLWIGDEAWELDYFLHENPEQKQASYAWLTDFVGWLPMPDGGQREAFLTADYNAEMIEHIARFPRVRDRAIFVGDDDDIVPDAFGPELPLIRDWTREHFSFAGYVTGFDVASFADREALRHELGYRDDEQVCIVTVGGSGVGGHLLRRVIEAFPQAKQQVPALRMVVVTGPRIDPAVLPQRRRARGAPVRPPALPAPGRLRPRGRAGRTEHVHGADSQPAAVPVLPARAPLRADLPRRPPLGAPPSRPADGLRQHGPDCHRRRHQRRDPAAPSTTGRSPRTVLPALRLSSPSCSRRRPFRGVQFCEARAPRRITTRVEAGCDDDADGNRIPVDVGAPPRTRARGPAQCLSQ